MEQRREFKNCFIRSTNMLTEGSLAERLANIILNIYEEFDF